jgi:hypothetical protein
MKWTAMVIVALGALLIGTFVADVWAGSSLNGFPSLKPVHYLNLGRDGYDLSSAKRERPKRMQGLFRIEKEPGPL